MMSSTLYIYVHVPVIGRTLPISPGWPSRITNGCVSVCVRLWLHHQKSNKVRHPDGTTFWQDTW